MCVLRKVSAFLEGLSFSADFIKAAVTMSYLRMLRSSGTACLFSLVATTLLASSAHGQETQYIKRTFAFLTGPDSVVDFKGDASQLVVVSKRSDYEEFRIADDAGDGAEELDGTRWVYQEAVHVTRGGDAPEGSFVWLLNEETPELPPKGAMTKTGPNSLQIISQTTYNIKLCGTDCSYGQDLKYYVPGYGTNLDKMVVVTALFQR